MAAGRSGINVDLAARAHSDGEIKETRGGDARPWWSATAWLGWPVHTTQSARPTMCAPSLKRVSLMEAD